MGNKEKADRDRLSISPPEAVLTYLDDLVAFGLHGKSRSEVAERMIVSEIERLIREGFLKQRQRK